MARRITPLAGLAVLAAAAAFAPADDDKAVPPAPVVPTKIDLPPKNFTETIPGSEVKFEMVYVPGGEFVMGSPADEVGRTDDEGPQVRVKVGAFWLEKHEVRWDEFDLWWKSEKLFAADDFSPRIAAPCSSAGAALASFQGCAHAATCSRYGQIGLPARLSERLRARGARAAGRPHRPDHGGSR